MPNKYFVKWENGLSKDDLPISRFFLFFINQLISNNYESDINMNISSINNEQDYQNALNRLEQIFDAEKGSEEGNEMETLGILIEKYENEHYPIASPFP